MLLESNKRFFKIYDTPIGARKRSSKPIPLFDKANKNAITVHKIINKAISNKEAKDKSDYDEIEVVKCEISHDCLVILFHRDALTAQDPSYRSKDKAGDIMLSKYKRKKDEQQAVSAHLVISGKRTKAGHRTALEEVPGLNMQAITHLLRKIFSNNPYSFSHPSTGQPEETTVTFTPAGLASEKFKTSLKQSRWIGVSLTKPSSKAVVDGLPGVRAKPQKMEIKIDADLDKSKYLNYIKKLIDRANDDGWDGIRVEMEFPEDGRKRSVAVDRESLAGEIKFVRSRLMKISVELENCTKSIIPEVVTAAKSAMK